MLWIFVQSKTYLAICETIELKLFAVKELGNLTIYGTPESDVADIAGSKAILPKRGTSNLELSK